MKLIITSLLAASASAFAPSAMPRHTTALCERVDSSSAIEAALAASKEFGAASPEARVLWDIVEEMDSADNTEAFKPVVVDEEYAEKVKALAQLLTKTKDELDMVKSLADSLKGVKIAQPVSSGSGSDDAAMKAALEVARSAEAGSVEAKLAWETVEEIASSNNLEATRAPLDEECLIELIEGCEALEKFKDALEAN
mmetsp:Transcript_17131/g.34253  ORF Transcript_17131/g.34253 Transcript_17131/m.34253 type:complete len:197 (+) Transcript_17131:126-716(+)